jgi:hypothetical protein
VAYGTGNHGGALMPVLTTSTAVIAGLVLRHTQAAMGGRVDTVARTQQGLAEGLESRFRETFEWKKGAVVALRFTTLTSRGGGGLGSLSSAGTTIIPVYAMDVFVVVRGQGKSKKAEDFDLFDSLNDYVRFELYDPSTVDRIDPSTGRTIHRFTRLEDGFEEVPGYLVQRHPFLLDVVRS